MSFFWRRMLCKHKQWEFVSNIYGDEINRSGGKRSMWKCTECGLVWLRDELEKAEW